ncbi:calcium-binding EGF-like domain-containing protein, partial [Hyalangium sp.]|uniref:calcium-binding EGF-like domain-containing protein n=1 Tax=Hyalangium sp. TaxID=2028555 RepID=UPI002D3521B4
MKVLKKLLTCARRLSFPSLLGLMATLLLAASACGPLPEGEPSVEPLAAAQRADTLAGNECASGANNCSIDATCTDTAEGFTCTCNADFAGDGVSCTRVSHTVELEPVADAMVHAGGWERYNNYGTSPEFSVCLPGFRGSP